MTFVARIVGGVVLVAIVLGIGLWAERQTDDDLSLPDEVAGLAIDDSTEGRDFAKANSAGLSDAYDGADAVTGRYGTGESESKLLVTAVRAKSGPPVPEWFGERNDVVEEDDVACLVTNGRRATILCQRTDGDLTVRVLGGKGSDAGELVDATNEVWEELS
jgi:hypothetical protein